MTNVIEETVDGYQLQAELYKAMAHPVRLRILDILSSQEACVCHLTALLRRRQPYISQQLALLREANLVTDRREGTIIYYRIRDAHLADLVAAGKRVLETSGQSPRLASLPAPGDPLPNCPCPRCQGRLQLASPSRRDAEGAPRGTAQGEELGSTASG